MENVRGESYTLRANPKPCQFEYLTENLETDVLVVGGGVTGCLTSYFLSKNGIKHTLIEQNRIASGSTSLTTALLEYQLDCNIADLLKYSSFEDIILAYKLNIEALHELDSIINKYGNDCYYNVVDSVLYSNKNSDIASLRREFIYRKEQNFDVSFFLEHDNPFDFDSKAMIVSHNGGRELDPYLFTHKLAKVSHDLGGKLFENTKAINVDYFDDYVLTTTEFGQTIKSKIIIVCTGFSTKLFTNRKFGTKTSTFSIITKPIENAKTLGIIVRNNEDIYTYFRQTHDKRIIFGGEDTDHFQGLNNQDVIDKKHEILEQNLKHIFKNATIEYKNSGTFATTNDNLGFIGIDPSNNKLWYNLGYGANGLVFATLGGRYLSDLFCNKQDERMKIFDIDR